MFKLRLNSLLDSGSHTAQQPYALTAAAPNPTGKVTRVLRPVARCAVLNL